jgi:hypothetical protein
VLQAHAAQHGPHAADDGQVQAQGDVFGTLPAGHERGGLGLGEHRAHGVDLDAPVGPQGKGAELLQGNLQTRGHEFEELSGARGAAVVHLEFGHPAGLGEADDLGVLAADVEHGPDLGNRARAPRA